MRVGSSPTTHTKIFTPLWANGKVTCFRNKVFGGSNPSRGTIIWPGLAGYYIKKSIKTRLYVNVLWPDLSGFVRVCPDTMRG